MLVVGDVLDVREMLVVREVIVVRDKRLYGFTAMWHCNWCGTKVIPSKWKNCK